MDTGDALVQTVQSLWPGAVASVSSGRAAGSALAEFAVVPHLRAPRLLVPARDPRAGAQALWRFNAASSFRETWGRTGLSAIVRSGVVRPFRDRIAVEGSDDGSLADHLAGLLGEPVTFSLGIGTARVNRKPVLQVFGEDGRSLAFAKLGDSDQARADVRAEAGSLAALAGHSWRTLAAPRLLHHGSWNGMELLVMTALPTTPWHRPGAQWRVPVAAMAELAESFGEPSRPLADLPWTARQRAIAADVAAAATAPAYAEEYAAAVHATLGRLAGTVWDVGAWHGDWTPWNMDRCRGRVQLWDWERFETGAPRGLDARHYCVNAVTRRDGTSPETILRGLELAGASRTRPDSRSHQLAALYLLAAAGRYVPLTVAAAGRHITERARCTLEALRLWTGEAGGSAPS